MSDNPVVELFHALMDAGKEAIANSCPDARSRALEEAAQIADEHASCEGIAQEIAARIRALKEKSDE